MKNLILLHGFATNKAIWEPILPALQAHFKVTNLDLPGCGDNTDIPPLAIELLAAKIADKITTPSIIAGWSLGGLIATKIAYLFPKKVTSLVNIGSTPKFLSDNNWQAGIMPERLKSFAFNLKQDYATYLNDYLSLHLRMTKLNAEEKKNLKDKLINKKSLESTLLTYLNYLTEVDLRSNIKEIKAKKLYIYGANDMLVKKDFIPQIMALDNNAKHIVYKRASHVPFLSRPETFIENLISYA